MRSTWQGPVTLAIPQLFHFVWFGPRLPDFGRVAIASALSHHPGGRAILWHESSLELDDEIDALRESGLELRVANSHDVLDGLAGRLGSDTTARLHQQIDALRQPAARSNLLRLLALSAEGGVYLDTDTLTLRPLDPLMGVPAFCGLEHVLYPAGTSRLDPRALLLGELRRLCAVHLKGWALHRRLLPQYALAANNAVLGMSAATESEAGLSLLARAASVPEKEWLVRFRLGTHLLQEELDEAPEGRWVQHEPRRFYPLGPVISRHYLRRVPDARAASKILVPEESFVLHWYASVGALERRSRAVILQQRDREVYAHLMAPYFTDDGQLRSLQART